MLAEIDDVHQVAPGPIDSVLAWRADDLQRDQSWIHRLTDRDIGELEAAATASKTGRTAILDMTKADFPLPILSTKIASLRRDIMDRFGFGYLRGLPADRYDRETLMRMFWGLSLPAPAPKRHLMRVWISLPDGRELHPAMAERWINIERGTVRGGINLPDLKAPTIPMDPLTPAFS
jgi:hypothetical protein